MLRYMRVTVEGHAYDVTVEDLTDTGNTLYPDHRSMVPENATAPVRAQSAGPAAPAPVPTPSGPSAFAGATPVLAPMSGVLAELKVAVGQTVAAGDVVAVMEAMKLKSPIVVDQAGTVASIDVAVGDAVEAGAPIISLS